MKKPREANALERETGGMDTDDMYKDTIYYLLFIILFQYILLLSVMVLSNSCGTTRNDNTYTTVITIKITVK
jgi:hypothetical protein